MSDFGNLLAYAEAQAGPAGLQTAMAKFFDAQAKEAAEKDKEKGQPAPAKR